MESEAGEAFFNSMAGEAVLLKDRRELGRLSGGEEREQE